MLVWPGSVAQQDLFDPLVVSLDGPLRVVVHWAEPKNGFRNVQQLVNNRSPDTQSVHVMPINQVINIQYKRLYEFHQLVKLCIIKPLQTAKPDDLDKVDISLVMGSW